ncbi:MAG: DNA ligase D [Acidobacteria bacterium]|nr:DNA ligase D [Acidobacteriota bacterium]
MLVVSMAKRQVRRRQAATAWRGDPRDVRPMLAESAPPSAHARLLSRPELVFEPKYDGIRALVALDGSAPPCLYTRLGRDKTAQFPDLVEPLAALGRRLRRPVLLDGEIVATGEDGAALPFQHLQERLHATGGAVRAAVRRVATALVVFDLLRDGDEDLRPLPFTERRRRLERLLRPDRSQPVRLIESTTGNGAALADRGLKRDWEGIIVKRPDGRYASGSRGSGWQKVKFTRTEEFVVGGWTLPRGSRPHFGALLLGYHAAGEGRPATGALVFAGQVGTGFTDAELDRIGGLLAPLATDTPPFVELTQPKPSEKRRWVEPVLVVQTGFSQWTPDGVLRHPVYHGLREDKRPADVRLPARRPPPGGASDPPARRAATRPTGRVEKEARTSPRTGRATAPARPEHRAAAPQPEHPDPGVDDLLAQLEDLERNRRRGTLVLHNGARVPVGNLHKVFWPEPGITKGELLRFQLRMAPHLLPVVADRPLVMKRFPNGVDGKSFYQHRAPDPLPDGLRVATVRESPDKPDSVVPYLVGGQLQTLLYMAQLAVISQDPWFSTLDDLESADQVALDLDPMPEATFDRVLDVACWLHDELERLGVPCFAKTSGSEGVHIFIPLPPGTPYEAGMIFCQIVATVVADAHPAAATVERMVRQRRPDAVYIDYLQNIYGKTLACAYSARASPFAGVSTPLTWTEAHEGVAAGLRPQDFTLRSIFPRLEQVGDLWARLRGAEPARLEAAFAYGE